ncbi:MAG: hypothetical protein LBS46_02720 [Dysgonamonadaceae bacterium]|nr:hypothetical protein [Dysgonamonadaceae bacterium]
MKKKKYVHPKAIISRVQLEGFIAITMKNVRVPDTLEYTDYEEIPEDELAMSDYMMPY